MIAFAKQSLLFATKAYFLVVLGRLGSCMGAPNAGSVRALEVYANALGLVFGAALGEMRRTHGFQYKEREQRGDDIERHCHDEYRLPAT
jgi:hypothetical protein